MRSEGRQRSGRGEGSSERGSHRGRQGSGDRAGTQRQEQGTTAAAGAALPSGRHGSGTRAHYSRGASQLGVIGGACIHIGQQPGRFRLKMHGQRAHLLPRRGREGPPRQPTRRRAAARRQWRASSFSGGACGRFSVPLRMRAACCQCCWLDKFDTGKECRTMSGFIALNMGGFGLYLPQKQLKGPFRTGAPYFN